jgi:hypothetical protein
MALKRGPNVLKSGPSPLKRTRNRVSFGQNETIFCRNLLASKVLQLWPPTGDFKPSPDKDLRLILAGTLSIGFHNSLSEFKMRRDAKPKKMDRVTKYSTRVSLTRRLRGATT